MSPNSIDQPAHIPPRGPRWHPIVSAIFCGAVRVFPPLSCFFLIYARHRVSFNHAYKRYNRTRKICCTANKTGHELRFSFYPYLYWFDRQLSSRYSGRKWTANALMRRGDIAVPATAACDIQCVNVTRRMTRILPPVPDDFRSCRYLDVREQRGGSTGARLLLQYLYGNQP